MEKNKKYKKLKKILVISVGIFLILLILYLYSRSHVHCWKYNDWWIVGGHVDEVEERYGEFYYDDGGSRAYTLEAIIEVFYQEQMKIQSLIYTLLVIIMSIISVTTVVALQNLILDNNSEYKLFYTLILVVGIVMLLIISMIMYGISEKNYMEKLQKKI